MVSACLSEVNARGVGDDLPTLILNITQLTDVAVNTSRGRRWSYS